MQETLCIYREAFNSKTHDLKSHRPYFMSDGRACITVAVNVFGDDLPSGTIFKDVEVPVGRAKLNKNQWIQVDQSMAFAVRSKSVLMKQLVNEGLILPRPENYDGKDAIFIRKDFVISARAICVSLNKNTPLDTAEVVHAAEVCDQ
jgi:hypothetical protein